MIINDKQYGKPYVAYKGTTSQINSITSVEEGSIAFATDTNLLGTFNGASWDWIAPSGIVSSGSGITSVVAGDDIYVDNSNPSAPIISLQEEIDVRKVQYDITYSGSPVEGQVCWNIDDGTLNVGMPGGNVILQVGQEQLVRVVNKTGSTITNGSVVYIDGQQGQKPSIAKAIASDNAIANCTIGVATEDILDNNNGYICTQGLVRDIDTSSFTAGNILYLSSSVAGGFQETAPETPNTVVGCGIVLSSHATEGVIAVRIKVLSTRGSRVILTDAGEYFTSSNVEGALQEIGSTLDSINVAGGVSVYDEGSIVASGVFKLNFVGENINASVNGDMVDVLVTVSGSSSSAVDILQVQVFS